MKVFKRGLILALIMFPLSGCVFTKLVSVPLRVTGAAISIIPGVGNTVHDTIDKAAEVVDAVPI